MLGSRGVSVDTGCGSLIGGTAGSHIHRRCGCEGHMSNGQTDLYCGRRTARTIGIEDIEYLSAGPRYGGQKNTERARREDIPQEPNWQTRRV